MRIELYKYGKIFTDPVVKIKIEYMKIIDEKENTDKEITNFLKLAYSLKKISEPNIAKR